MTGRRLICALLHGLLAATLSHAQQICDGVGGATSSPAARFNDEGDGTVVDARTQLMWMRCAVGQTWREGACTGAATRHSWGGGRGVAEAVNQTGTHFFNDWRLPSVRELATVTEYRCVQPRINLVVFPATPAATFWTGTGRIGQDDAAYVFDFSAGGVGHAPKSAEHHVRLVRNAP